MLTVILEETDYTVAQHQNGAAEAQLLHEVVPDPHHLFPHLPEQSKIHLFPNACRR